MGYVFFKRFTIWAITAFTHCWYCRYHVRSPFLIHADAIGDYYRTLSNIHTSSTSSFLILFFLAFVMSSTLLVSTTQAHMPKQRCSLQSMIRFSLDNEFYGPKYLAFLIPQQQCLLPKMITWPFFRPDNYKWQLWLQMRRWPV